MALRPPMGNMVITQRPFQRVYIDIIGPFPRTRSGHICILIMLIEAFEEIGIKAHYYIFKR